MTVVDIYYQYVESHEQMKSESKLSEVPFSPRMSCEIVFLFEILQN